MKLAGLVVVILGGLVSFSQGARYDEHAFAKSSAVSNGADVSAMYILPIPKYAHPDTIAHLLNQYLRDATLNARQVVQIIADQNLLAEHHSRLEHAVGVTLGPLSETFLMVPSQHGQAVRVHGYDPKSEDFKWFDIKIDDPKNRKAVVGTILQLAHKHQEILTPARQQLLQVLHDQRSW